MSSLGANSFCWFCPVVAHILSKDITKNYSSANLIVHIVHEDFLHSFLALRENGKLMKFNVKLTHICLVDYAILINWMNPFPLWTMPSLLIG